MPTTLHHLQTRRAPGGESALCLDDVHVYAGTLPPNDQPGGFFPGDLAVGAAYLQEGAVTGLWRYNGAAWVLPTRPGAEVLAVTDGATVEDTTDETTIFTFDLATVDIKVGDVINFRAFGTAWATATPNLWIRGRVGSSGSFATALWQSLTGTAFDVDYTTVVAPLGHNGVLRLSGNRPAAAGSSVGLTGGSPWPSPASKVLNVTAEWGAADPDNRLVVQSMALTVLRSA